MMNSGRVVRVLLLLVLAFIVIVVVTTIGNGGSNGSGGSIVESLSVAQRLVGGGSSGSVVVTTQDVVNGRFYSKNANCSWVTGDELSWISRAGDLVRVGVGSGGEKRIVIRSEQFVARPWKVKFSGDGERVLVGFEPRRLFRSTILARYAVHDASTGVLIAQLRVHQSTDQSSPQSFQSATWSDNRTVIVTHKNDLYAVQINDADSVKVKRITSDGSDTVTNGVADWVYEEEVFTQSSTTVYPSPTSTHVTYIKFNDSTVTPLSYNLYGDYSDAPFYNDYFQYPKFGTVRYPKSGTPNPTVSIHVYKLSDDYCWGSSSTGGSFINSADKSCSWDLNLNDLMGRLVPSGDADENYIVCNIKWLTPTSFAMQVMNRVQNSSWLLDCDVLQRGCEVVRKWEQSMGWIEVSQLGASDGSVFALMSVGGGGSSGGKEYNHIAQVGRDTVRFLTSGSWSVDEIVGVQNGVIIFKAPLLSITPLSVHTSDPTQSHYYSLQLPQSTNLPPTSPLTPKPKCLTCYNACTWNNAKFSSDLTHFVNSCERQTGVLHVDVIKTQGAAAAGGNKVLVKLEDNRQLEKALDGVKLPVVEYFSYEYLVGGRNYTAYLRVVGLEGWRDRQGLGVVVDVYGGPTSQKVTRRFTPNDWSYSLTSNNKIIYLTIDGVGSGRQSNSLSFEVYRDLGNHEITDKISILKRFLNEHPNVDSRKTLIWGWSYGGYLSAMVMGKDTGGVFKCGISVAPVVDWRYYDTIYTERYMSTPEDNPAGYNSSNVLNYLDNFKDKQYLLVHGNADDNVHYQQSMVLARGLEQAGILFRMQSYPDENHSLGGVRPHLFATLDDFVIHQCFKD